MNLFRRSARLVDGTRVYEDDMLEWTDSDNMLRHYPLTYSKWTRRLYFCNADFALSAYPGLRKRKEETK
jgi:hypothetical protein